MHHVICPGRPTSAILPYLLLAIIPLRASSIPVDNAAAIAPRFDQRSTALTVRLRPAGVNASEFLDAAEVSWGSPERAA
jgi:hypothetical protein